MTIKVQDYVTTRGFAAVYEVVRFADGDEHMARLAPVTGNGDNLVWYHTSSLTLFAEYLDTASCGCPVYTRVGVQHVDECSSTNGCGVDGCEGLPSGVEPEAKTCQQDHVLADELHFSKQLQRGRLFANDVRGLLAFGRGGGSRWASNRTEDENRAAMRAFGEWLIRFSERAR